MIIKKNYEAENVKEPLISFSFLKKLLRFSFYVFLIILLVTLFTKSRYKNQSASIVEDAVKEPLQISLVSPKPIIFNKDGYSYRLDPVADYEISGLVVSRFDYTKFSIYKTDSVFPMDLCLIWGENVEGGAFKEKSLKFKQDARFCWYSWSGENFDFNTNQVSNNHLVIQSDLMKNKVFDISKGDQVKIKGKLVNIKAIPLEESKRNGAVSWHSSTTRQDTGAGACEVIFVEDIKVLKQANFVSKILFKASLVGLIVVTFFRVLVSLKRWKF